ncbi:hypothetical protein B0T22DRAFT_470887 [Podospora appendiculata]|uniref:Uncharacterized protein n=1 Tax=Podospora appendiculata TaxID=314037 RepID=A0AAE0X0U0_9PEZI|nr:hypothetical protein B0T22DRAFT_470887 [Podospora appendiculata]
MHDERRRQPAGRSLGPKAATRMGAEAIIRTHSTGYIPYLATYVADRGDMILLSVSLSVCSCRALRWRWPGLWLWSLALALTHRNWRACLPSPPSVTGPPGLRRRSKSSPTLDHRCDIFVFDDQVNDAHTTPTETTKVPSLPSVHGGSDMDATLRSTHRSMRLSKAAMGHTRQSSLVARSRVSGHPFPFVTHSYTHLAWALHRPGNIPAPRWPRHELQCACWWAPTLHYTTNVR